MFLTLFYIISSYVKMWQLQSIRTKLLQHISSTSCVAFYRMSERAQEFVAAYSPHCTEPDKAHISDFLVIKNNIYGCALSPLLRVDLASWRAPPPNPVRIAFLPDVKPSLVKQIDPQLEALLPSTSAERSAQETLDVLLECTLEYENLENVNILPTTKEDCDTWEMIAWKVSGPNLALALHGNITQLTCLVSIFLEQESPMIRIMTVKFDNTPKLLDEIECSKLAQDNIYGSPRHCLMYVNTLKAIADASSSNDPDIICGESKLKHDDIIHTVEPVVSKNVASEPPVKVHTEETNHIEENKKTDDAAAAAESSRKSDLKLELNNKITNGKSHAKHHLPSTSRMRTNSSKNILLDEPIAVNRKSNKGGGSCPILPTVRPPNVLIYSESAMTRENISKTLRSVLDPDRYAIYCSGDEAKLEAAGSNGAALLVAGGALTARASAALLSAFLGGARILSLCSDFLISVLPFYQTAEVRERELVSFTYERWKSVKLLHNVFCYQASPAKRQFSGGSSNHPSEYKGHGSHTIKVEVLAAEQTWHTPSLLRATDDKSDGMAVFSQVHLELDSREYLNNEAVSAEKARLGVLRKILDSLGLATAPSPIAAIISSEPCYTPAYFLGTYERKQESAEAVAVGCLKLVLPKIAPPPASSTVTPLLLHACPENFSTLIYFQELTTKNLGRLVVYSEVLSSTQKLINEQTRVHGLVIIADRQTQGSGRGGTVWLSPPGCAMFSVQIIAKMSDYITSRPALMQHISALACVLAVRSLPNYENFDLRIKWPNDIYFGNSVKLGGIVVNTTVIGDQIVFNIGIGINLDNKIPTKSINDIIKEKYGQLPMLEREKLIAHILKHLENMFESINDTNDFTEFYDLYYKYWLHTDQEVLVIQEGNNTNTPTKCCILGIDENGYLLASGPNGTISLQPDGNTFDMMKGLIAPKLRS